MGQLTEILTQIVSYTSVYALASLGIVIGGRTGVFNISGEGIMLASASAGFIAAYQTGNWFMGFLVGALMGALFGLILIYIHEKLKISQFILGITLVILGTGLSDLLYKTIVGVQLFAPEAPPVPDIRIPGISQIPIISAFLNQDIVVYFAYIAVFAAYYIFYHTRLGLETRAIGEDPKAADVVGINVKLRRYVTTIIGGSLMGLAGAYLPLVVTGTYTTNISNGRGFMAIGIAIFASWRPERALLGAFIFAAIEVFSFQQQLGNSLIPYQFLLMLPFISVLLIMWIFRKRVEFPAALGKPYSRE
ncbi:MAG TPA: ABC transporter permease [Halanaerobiales bacterium]|nr:ABC transporter permease [Halanaerobiales bacterium]